ncbi:unnamed protein product [Cyclocybe aegerita]|uniref:DUF6593 domain-containing protein n=1 Tax=Cyclocybe aegerita TaxID=1973307 RepID=A0A8S0WMM0_CYCAE|nr:unnamed protein product [Cyclocybe aegerita]
MSLGLVLQNCGRFLKSSYVSCKLLLTFLRHALDSRSQVTLVNPEPITELVLTKNSALNTLLLYKGKARYQVATVDANAARTTITDVRSGELLAEIKRRTFHSDTVKFTHFFDGKAVKIKEWLREEKMANGHKRWNIESSAGNFSWRKDVTRRLALCPSHNMESPIVWLQLPTKEKPYALVFKGGVESFVAQILAAFVILEQEIRLEEKEFFRADGFVCDERTLAGMYVDTGNFNRR